MNVFASLNKRRVFMTCGVLGIALLCGQVMQAWDNPLARFDNSVHRTLPADPAASNLQMPPMMPGRVRTSFVAKIQDVAKPAAAICIPQLNLKSAPGGMIDMTFLGCKERTVVVTHNEIQVTAKTSAAGKLHQSIPALEATARVTVSFDGDAIDSTLTVPDADMYQHIAIVWSGPQILQMHAFEFGAKRDQFGHVWSGAPKSPKRAMRGNGGFMTRLGDGSGASAEVYSFPTGQTQNQGVIRLVVEAGITPANCGKQINAMALQSSPLGGIDATEVALKMPQCDGIGQVVRLQNLFQDLRLAMR